jgi:hypothetical protein
MLPVLPKLVAYIPRSMLSARNAECEQRYNVMSNEYWPLSPLSVREEIVTVVNAEIGRVGRYVELEIPWPKFPRGSAMS